MAERSGLLHRKVIEQRERGYVFTEDDTALVFPRFDETPDGIYLIEPIKQTRSKFAYFQRELTNEQIALMVAEYGAQLSPRFADAYKGQALNGKQKAIVMPSQSHLFSLIAQGLANGAVLDTAEGKVLLRAVTKSVPRMVGEQEEEDEEDEDNDKVDTKKKAVVRFEPTTRITLLRADGGIQDITKPEDLQKFVGDNGLQLMELIRGEIEPVYEFDFCGGVLKDHLDELRLTNKTGTHHLLAAQKHTAAAVLAELQNERAMILAGDPGVGKTVIASAVLDASRFRKPSDVRYNVYQWLTNRKQENDLDMIVCPGHLVNKWEAELRSISPTVVIARITLGEGNDPQQSVNDFFRAWDEYPVDAIKVIITTDTAVKSGEYPNVWCGAYETSRARGAASRRRMMLEYGGKIDEPMFYDPISGRRIGVYRKVGSTKALSPRPASAMSKMPMFMDRHTHDSAGHDKDRKQGKKKFRVSDHMLAGFNNEYNYAFPSRRQTAVFEVVDPEEEARLARHKANDINRRIRIARAEFEAKQPSRTPLWQEHRSASAHRIAPTALLTEKLQEQEQRITHVVMPLPDLAMQHLEPHQYHIIKNPRAMAGGIAQYISKFAMRKFGKRLHTMIVDEAHEYANDSGRGEAVMNLAFKAQKVLLMTGTPFGGKAQSVFRMEYMLNRRRMQDAGYTFDAQGKLKWTLQMGVYDMLIDRKQMVAALQRVALMKPEGEIRERPGAQPLLMRWQLANTLYLSIEEVGAELPPYHKGYSEVELDESMAEILDEAKEIVAAYNKECLANKQAPMPITSEIIAHLTWLSFPFAPYVIEHTISMEDEITLQRFEEVIHVHTIPALPEEYITSKERMMLERLQKNLDAGRGTGLYFRMTGTGKSGNKDVLGRMQYLINQEVPLARVAVLRSDKVKRIDRENWLDKRKDHEVLLCNPITVRTGLDLYQYVDLIAMEWDYSLTTMMQASKRAWRIGQKRECKFEVWYYGDTVEQDATIVMNQKWEAADFLAGRSANVGALVSGGSLVQMLAEAYATGKAFDKSALFRNAAQDAGDFKSAAKQAEKTVLHYNKVETLEGRTVKWKDDHAKYGKNVTVNQSQKTAIFKVDNERKVLWLGLPDGGYERQSIVKDEVVFRMLFTGSR